MVPPDTNQNAFSANQFSKNHKEPDVRPRDFAIYLHLNNDMEVSNKNLKSNITF